MRDTNSSSSQRAAVSVVLATLGVLCLLVSTRDYTPNVQLSSVVGRVTNHVTRSAQGPAPHTPMGRRHMPLGSVHQVQAKGVRDAPSSQPQARETSAFSGTRQADIHPHVHTHATVTASRSDSTLASVMLGVAAVGSIVGMYLWQRTATSGQYTELQGTTIHSGPPSLQDHPQRPYRIAMAAVETYNVSQGKVQNVTGKDLKSMIESGWTVLDVRPNNECEVVGIKGAVEVPLFKVDDNMDAGTLLKKMSAFGMGGWWEGSTHMKANTQFMAQVQSKIPKDAKVIITCQKGLRSLAACQQLSRAGYQELAWVSGGLDTVRPGDVETTIDKDLRYAGIGGLSSVVGWTKVQQEEKDTISLTFKVVATLLVLDALLFAVEYLQSQQAQ